MTDLPVRQLGQWVSALLCAGSSALVLSPVLSAQTWDSFPLSTYPMFAQPRTVLSVTSVWAEHSDGNRSPVPPRLLGSDEVLQAQAVIRQARRAGPVALNQLCQRVAQRLEETHSGSPLRRLVFLRRELQPILYLRERDKNDSMPSPHSPGVLNEHLLVSCRIDQ